MRISLRARASLDLDEAFTWYEARRPGLGEMFLSAIDDCLERISRDPQIYAVQDDRIRRARARRVPFWVYFVVREDRMDVLAVYHQRRKPRESEV